MYVYFNDDCRNDNNSKETWNTSKNARYLVSSQYSSASISLDSHK